MKKTLIIVVHPNIESSIYNKALIEGVKDIKNVDICYLYDEYKEFKIDIKREQERLVKYDRVVFQFPFYWYSSPALLKEWQDVVLTLNFENENMLKGKEFVIVTTVGAKEGDYISGKLKEFISVDNMFIPMKATFKLMDIIYKGSLIFYEAVPKNRDNQSIDNFIEKYISMLKS